MTIVLPDSPTGPTARRKRLAQLLRQRAQGSTVRSPASVAQSGLWFMQEMDPSSRAYHVAFCVRVTSKLDGAAVADALQHLVDRHPMLRSTFHHTGEELEIHVKGAAEPQIDAIDASGWDDLALRHRVQDTLDQPFDLATGPLFRMAIFKCRPDDHVLLLALHHLICDGWSLFIIINEFMECYEASLVDRAPRLSPTGPEFADLVRRQQVWLASDAAARCRAYWLARLSGNVPQLVLPASSSAAGNSAAGHGRYRFDVEDDIYIGLTRVARSCGVSLFGVLLAAHQVLLMALSGQEEILVGVPMAGRTQPGSETVVGHFVNVVALRCDLRGNPSFNEVIERSWTELQNATENQELPFLEIVRILGPAYRSGRTPLIRTLFNFLKPPPGNPLAELSFSQTEPITSGPLTLVPFPVDVVEEGYDLSCNVIQYPDRLHVRLQYNRAIFSPQTVADLSCRLTKILRQLAADSSCPVRRFCEAA
jgi:hypothetical protein